MGGLAGDAEHGGDLGPRRAPVQRPGHRSFQVGPGCFDGGDVPADGIEGVVAVTALTIHDCQDTLTCIPVR